MIRNKLIAFGLCIFLALSDPAMAQQTTPPVSAETRAAEPEPATATSGRGYYTMPGGQMVHVFEIIDHTTRDLERSTHTVPERETLLFDERLALPLGDLKGKVAADDGDEGRPGLLSNEGLGRALAQR